MYTQGEKFNQFSFKYHPKPIASTPPLPTHTHTHTLNKTHPSQCSDTTLMEYFRWYLRFLTTEKRSLPWYSYPIFHVYQQCTNTHPRQPFMCSNLIPERGSTGYESSTSKHPPHHQSIHDSDHDIHVCLPPHILGWVLHMGWTYTRQTSCSSWRHPQASTRMWTLIPPIRAIPDYRRNPYGFIRTYYPGYSPHMYHTYHTGEYLW